MKPAHHIALCALTGLLMFTNVGRAADLVVATDTAFVPFEFKDGDKYAGFDIDLWEALAKDIGVTYTLQPMDFNGILPALQTKQVDVGIAGMTISEERRQVVDFSDGYYDSGLLLLVPADSPIAAVEDLDGKTLAVKTGTSAADYAKANIKKAELRLFPNSDNAFLEVITGRADAAMHDTPSVLYYIHKFGEGKVKAAGSSIEAQQYGIAFPKGSDLVSKVNTSLAKLKGNGTYLAIYKKWFGTEPPQD